MDDHRGRSRVRQSRWDNGQKDRLAMTVPFILPAGLGDQEIEAFMIRVRIDELLNKLKNKDYDLEIHARSPSPPPVYDGKTGKRMNTREQRYKDKLEKELAQLIEKAKFINPRFQPPANFKPKTLKKTKKIYLPVKQFPDYNFIGLILGPRGTNHKKLEEQSKCKIYIRGKGSVKGGTFKPEFENDVNNLDEDLHLLIVADAEESISKAEQLLTPYMTPMEDSHNTIKQEQLKQLAIMNGTYIERNQHYLEHKAYVTNVYCRHCGEISHPSSDCPFKNKQLTETEKKTFDDEYTRLMASIDGGDGAATAAPHTEMDDVYNQLMAAIDAPKAAPQQPAQQQPAAGAAAPMDPSAYYTAYMQGQQQQQQQQQQQYYNGQPDYSAYYGQYYNQQQ